MWRKDKTMKTCTCGIKIINHPASRCLDALVAEKVMGWEKNTTDTHYGGNWEKDGKLMGGIYYWKPSTDISAALEVFEKSDLKAIEKRKGGYCVASDFDEQGYLFGYNPSALPLAISRAALLEVKE